MQATIERVQSNLISDDEMMRRIEYQSMANIIEQIYRGKDTLIAANDLHLYSDVVAVLKDLEFARRGWKVERGTADLDKRARRVMQRLEAFFGRQRQEPETPNAFVAVWQALTGALRDAWPERNK